MADGDACDVWGDWVGDTYAYACLVETDVEAALVHGHFQLLFVILVATRRLALERSRETALGFPCQIVPVIYDSSRIFCVKPWL